MSIYKDYLVGEEREAAIMEASIMNELDMLETMFEMTTLKLEQMHKDAEFKVFKESGTYEDLTYLIVEANNEVAEQQTNIIGKIIEAIKKLFSNIRNFITGKKGKGNPDDLIEIDEGYLTSLNKVKDGWNNLKNTITSNPVKAIVAAAGTIGTITAVTVTTGKIIKKKRSELESSQDEANSVLGSLEEKFNNVSNILNSNTNGNANNNSEGSKALNLIKSIISTISNIVKGIGNALGKGVGAVKDTVTGAVDKITNKEGKEKAKAAEANKKEQENANKQGVLIKNMNGVKYSIDRTTGSVSKEENGGWVNIDINSAPDAIKKAAMQQKGKAAMRQKESDKQKENQSAINSNYAQSASSTNPETGAVVKIDGKTGIINAKDRTNGNLVRLNSIDDIGKYLPGIKFRKERRKLKEAYNKIMDGINNANKTKEAVNTNESAVNFEEIGITSLLTEASIDYKIDGDELVVNIDDTMTESELVEFLNDNGYVVEMSDDYITITEGEFVSTSESIFGYDITSEITESEESYDAFDEEMEELSELFTTL